MSNDPFRVRFNQDITVTKPENYVTAVYVDDANRMISLDMTDDDDQITMKYLDYLERSSGPNKPKTVLGIEVDILNPTGGLLRTHKYSGVTFYEVDGLNIQSSDEFGFWRTRKKTVRFSFVEKTIEFKV